METAAIALPPAPATPAAPPPQRVHQLPHIAAQVLRFGVWLPARVPPGWLERIAGQLAGPLLAALPAGLRKRLVLDMPKRDSHARAPAAPSPGDPTYPRPVGSLPQPKRHVLDLQLCLPAPADPAPALAALQQAAAACGLLLCEPVAGAASGPWHAEPGVTWRIELRTPWPLPCPLHCLQTSQLWSAATQRLRDWGAAAPSGPPAAGRLLCQHARWQPAPGCPHGSLLGALFIVEAGAGWASLLQAVQPMHLCGGTAAGPLGWRGAFHAVPQRGAWLDLGLVNLRRLRLLAGASDTGDDLPAVLPDPADPASWQGERGTAQAVADDLRLGRYQPQPSQAIALHRPGKPPRWVERLARRDALVQRHLLALLGPVLERSFHPCSFGFRPGLGRPEALRAVRDGLAAGCTHVVKTDIARCFDSVPHAQVWQALDALLLPQDKLLRAALQAVLRQPCGHDETPRPRLAGLAQGAPLSPLLANLVLGGIDTALADLPVRLVRYADDLVILAHGKADARRALEQVRSAAAALGLQLAPDKTRIGHVQEGFSFLGEHFSPHSVEPVEAATVAQRKPLVITWAWLELGVNGPCLEARHAGKPLGRWPLRRLNALIVLAPAALSTSLLDRCATYQVAVALSLHGGRSAVVLPPEQRHHLDRQAQHLHWHAAQSAGERLALAQALVDAKIGNGMALVRQRQPADPLLDSLHEVRRLLPRAGSTAVLRGHEGHAAKLMFRWLNGQILPALRPAFGAARRARGAPDRLNSMLNLSYHLLRSRLSILLRTRALNPYLGWLHDADDNYETLTYDLMEPFRPLVDRLVLRMVNRQELRAVHFDTTPGQQRLTPDGAARLVQAFERALGERVGAHLWRDMLWVQVQAVATLARHDGPFWVFHWQPRDKQPNPHAPAQGGSMLALGSADDLNDANDPGLSWWPGQPARPADGLTAPRRGHQTAAAPAATDDDGAPAATDSRAGPT